jgi:predicted esterase
MNILCFNGCCQDSDIFKSLLKDYIKLSPNMNWFFYEAKYNHSRCGKTWFQPELSLDQIGQDVVEIDEIKSVLSDIHDFIINNSINVLFGFSQGGNVIDSYLRLYETSNLKCSVICSGYSFPMLVKIKNDINLPILYLGSEADDIVPLKEKPIYKNEKIILHDKGHKVPTQKAIVRQIIDFINRV